MNINCIPGCKASQNTTIFKIFFQILYKLVNATARDSTGHVMAAILLCTVKV
jgi:hypothetical protein